MSAISCNVRVLRQKAMAPDIRRLTVALPKEGPLPKAGQFYMLRAWAANESPVLSRPISVHDVFHQRHALPFTEGAVILKWLDNNTTDHFTASAARSPHTHQKLTELKKELDLAEPIHTAQHNPMIFFHMPANPRPGAHIPPQRPTPTNT